MHDDAGRGITLFFKLLQSAQTKHLCGKASLYGWQGIKNSPHGMEASGCKTEWAQRRPCPRGAAASSLARKLESRKPRKLDRLVLACREFGERPAKLDDLRANQEAIPPPLEEMID